MKRSQVAMFAVGMLLLAAAVVTGAVGYFEWSMGLGWSMLAVLVVWATAVIVDRLENTPVVVPDYVPLSEEGSRYYGGR